jgi:hypothetical protein
MPSWTLLNPSDSLLQLTGLTHNDALNTEIANPASIDGWVSLILESAPYILTQSAYPDALSSFVSELSTKFPSANLSQPTKTPEAAQLLDFYIPSSPVLQYIVSPLYESLNKKENGREFYYRPSHSLLPYQEFDASPSGDVSRDTSGILAIFKAGTWDIPKGSIAKWWREFKEDKMARVLNYSRESYGGVDALPNWVLHEKASVGRNGYGFNIPSFRMGTQIVKEGDLVRIVDREGSREFLLVQKIRFYGGEF